MALLLPRAARPAWGLHEYWQATGDPAARDAASRTAGLFLDHQLFRSRATGQVIHRAWLAPLASRISDFGISSRERPGGRCRPVRSAQHGGKGGAP